MAAGALHSVTWMVWVLAAAASVELAPNPLYVTLVVAASAAVVAGHRSDSGIARAFPLLLGFGVAFATLRVVLTALTTHGSGGSVLLTTPAVTLPTALGGFTVGGPVEASVVLTAAAGSFAVIGIMAAFGAFNSVVSHHELVQAAPRAFYEAGLVLTVSLAFVPSIVLTAQRAAEADRARLGGARPPRRRAFRLVVPVLESALDRAIALSESMDSRGFGRDASTGRERTAAIVAGTGLAGLLVAFVALVGGQGAMAAAAGVAGTVLVGAAVLVTSSGPRRPRHRRRRIETRDVLTMVVAASAPAILCGLRVAGAPSLVWSSAEGVPPFEPLAAGALLLLLAPALVRPRPDRALEPAAAGPDAIPALVP